MPNPTCIQAATETILTHGVEPDRCDVLQDGNTLVLRLTETLVARVVTDSEGPRQGTEWFARENAVALHLTQAAAPIISLHGALPPGPHLHLGFAMNFWEYVTSLGAEPDPAQMGSTLYACHAALRSFPDPLPRLAILEESLSLLDRNLFPAETVQLLRSHLTESLLVLSGYPQQPLHGDAHPGNLLLTTRGLLWTDWEDAFAGPVEWDLASLIWNAQILDNDQAAVDKILSAYQLAGGKIDGTALDQCLTARAAVMTAWYPILYPNPSSDRVSKLARRIAWLHERV